MRSYSGGGQTQTVDDLIVLGRACPDFIRNGRITVCTAGYSEKHGFIRVYPTRMDSPLKRWNIVKVALEKNPLDTRMESWKIQGSKSEWDMLSEKIEVVGKLKKARRLDIVANLIDGCVGHINSAKRSLGIIKPRLMRPYFAKREDHWKGNQLDLLGKKLPKTKKDYSLQPRIKYHCVGACEKGHDQQLLEWGVHEWIRKNPHKAQQVWDNLRLYSMKHQVYFFVGNQVHRRNAFMVISVLPLKRRLATSILFPFKKFEKEA